MKIRTLNELQNRLDDERKWRLREIDDLKHTVRSAEGFRRDTIIRAGIALLYAHWEGFIKNAVGSYLDFVRGQRHIYDDLATCFIALGARRRISELTISNKSKANNAAVDFIRDCLSQRAQLPDGESVSTKSNLSSKVFSDLMNSIGLSLAHYETRFKLIDKSLVERRNEIAHGNYVDLDAESFRKLADEVLELISNVKADIENAASLKAYKRNP